MNTVLSPAALPGHHLEGIDTTHTVESLSGELLHLLENLDAQLGRDGVDDLHEGAAELDTRADSWAVPDGRRATATRPPALHACSRQLYGVQSARSVFLSRAATADGQLP